MSSAIEKIQNAYKWAIANRPKVNGFPFLAEALKQAGVDSYVCHLPSAQCIYHTHEGAVVGHAEYVVSGMMNVVPRFNQEAFIKVLRSSQQGDSTFTEFLKGTWESGVVHYEADLNKRTVTYFGVNGESYREEYPMVTIST